MEERKAAKALPFACHFSLTGTVRFFCCFFGRRLAVVPSIELALIFQHLNELFTISSRIFHERKLRELTATPCPGKDTIVSCILISELQEALFGWNLTFDTMLGKRKHYESRRHFFSTPHMLGQSITNWGHNTLSVPKNELRAGHELRKTLSFKEQIMFKGKYTSVLLGQTGILCSLYLRQFLRCVQ